jgi:hypothetical protein
MGIKGEMAKTSNDFLVLLLISGATLKLMSEMRFILGTGSA